MKILITAAVAGLGLAMATAHAGEGNGNPFPFRAPGLVTTTTGRAVLPGGSTDPYPFRGNSSAMLSDGAMPMNGSEGGVETANSLPRGFEKGTAAYAQTQSMQRYRAAQIATKAALVAQHQQAVPPYKG